MRGASIVGTPRVSVARFKDGRTSDRQPFLELVVRPILELFIEQTNHRSQRTAKRMTFPTFRAWYPFSRKSLAELAVMGMRWSPSGLIYREEKVFVVDLISVACSDEEAHGVDAQRFFVRNPRPLKGG